MRCPSKSLLSYSFILLILCLTPIGCERAERSETSAKVRLEKKSISIMTETSKQKFTNRLAKEKSPYLLQHADNPVDWYPWGDEAFAKAKKEDKPVFLSIGYSTCHWCHVMEHESFESEEIAKKMNEYFVSIKVDREERPDIDNIYMSAVQAMTGRGGWPLTVILTHDKKPFYGGTYFPPYSKWGSPGLMDIMESVPSTVKFKPLLKERSKPIFSILTSVFKVLLRTKVN